MKTLTYLTLLSSLSLLNAQSLTSAFENASVDGNLRYYYIQTDKDPANAAKTSAHAHAVGGHLSLKTDTYHGFYAKTTFMTTNGFSLPSLVDTSVLSKDNGARGLDAKDGITILGEAYLGYAGKQYSVEYGRKVIKTPIINAKDVRMIPSSVSGLFGAYDLDESMKFELAYIDEFKQRTSDKFMGIVSHALGSNTQAIVGSEDEYVVHFGMNFKASDFTLRIYDDYATNFMNTLYIDASKKFDNLTFAAQYINQSSVGNADNNLQKSTSLTAGRAISTNAFALKAEMAHKSSIFGLAYSNVLKDDNKHDSLVLPWDGTPLFTNMITANNLFQSIYGKALTADSVYIGGTQGLKLYYKQKYDSLGLKGFSTTLSYLNSFNDRYAKNQQDYNIVLSYKYNKALSIQSKTMIVKNNTSVNSLKTISQIENFEQYRFIVNYKF